MTNYNSIVIGGGVNSLVVATMLGKKGKKVLLLEARNQIGGLASNLEFGGKEGNILYVTATISLYKMELNQVGARYK